jgi:2-hydroxychromene-2-carboxylate isomerase
MEFAMTDVLITADDLDIADGDSLALLLRGCGADVDVVTAASHDPATHAAYESNTRDAISAGAFGSPTYRVGDQIYFGQDRLEFVQAAVAQAHPHDLQAIQHVRPP